MFTPLGGPLAGLSFIETFLSTLSGGFTAAFLFYFTSEYFMIRAKRKRKEAYLRALESDRLIKQKRSFTRFNKIIVKLKNTFGIYIICWLVPLFLSVPLGTMICIKFYGKDKRTIWIILLGLTVNCLLITSLVYALKTAIIA